MVIDGIQIGTLATPRGEVIPVALTTTLRSSSHFGRTSEQQELREKWLGRRE